MSLVLERGQGVETVSAEDLGDLDGQGAPTYGSPYDVEARVVREDKVVVLANGSQVRTVVTLWIDAGQDPRPGAQARVTTADGLVGIVVEELQRKTLSGNLDHVRLRLREE